MNVSPTIQKIILSLVILSGLGFVVYSTIFGEVEIPVDSEGVPIVSDVAGQDLLVLADKLNSIEIKKSIFSSSLFTELKDITVPLQNEDQGRSNPFSKVGSDTTTVSVSRP